MRAGARKKTKNKFILEKGEFKLWHVEILTKQKQSTLKRISLRLLSQSPQWQKPWNRLLFGVDSAIQANDLLQNNIEEFEWIVRNKIYPNFYGRFLTGENCLTKEEIDFLHSKGCKIAAIYADDGAKQTEEQGSVLAKRIDLCAL